MKIIKIDESEYHLSRARETDSFDEEFISPNGLYKLRFLYVTEYRFGDFLGHLELVRLIDNQVVWQYTESRLVRQLYKNPWSADSSTIYFSVVENGNQIWSYDVAKNKMALVFENPNVGHSYLNWIWAVSSKMNAMFYVSVLYEKEFEKNIFYVFLKEENKSIILNECTKSNLISICENKITGNLFCIDKQYIKVFDLTKKEIISVFDIGALTLGSLDFRRIHTHFDQLENGLFLEVQKVKKTEYYKIDF